MTEQENQACCAHLNVVYSPEDNGDGTLTSAWKCVTCDHKFNLVLREKYPKIHSTLSELQKIADRMKGQDNRATSHPVFQVRETRRIYGIDPTWGQPVVWTYEGDEYDDSSDDADYLEAVKHYEETREELEGWTRTSYIDIEVVVHSFFSAKAAEDYVTRFHYNYKNPYVYVETGYRNDEWQAIRNVLLGLVKED